MAVDDWYLVGAPWDCSGAGRGESQAPRALRAAGLAALVTADAGDAATIIRDEVRDPSTGVLALAQTVRAAGTLAAALTDAADRWPGRRPVVVGGDCSVLLGIFPWLHRHRPRAGLWFVDAHPDFQDGAASETGETADMDLAILTGRGADPLVALANQVPMVADRDVVLLGHRTRALDPAAAAEVARVPAGIRRLDAPDVVAAPRAAGEQAAQWLADVPDGVWLHIDVDVLDPDPFPAVTYPMVGGPDLAQLLALLQPLADSPQLIGMSVADFRPDLDPSGRHAAQIVGLLRSLLDR